MQRRHLLIGAGIATAGLACPSIARAQDKVVLKFGHLANEQNIWNKAALSFADEVKKRSDGSVTVQVFPNEQLGAEMDVINGIQLGTADMTITGESLQNWAPSAALLAVPYAIKELGHLDAVAKGQVGQHIEQQIRAKVNLRPLAYFARGPRELTSNREVKRPDALNGLRLRVPNVPLFVAVWQALGAKPTPMAFNEVFTALQNHTIDAQENPLSLIKSASFFEVQKYVNRTDHVRSWIYVVIGEPQFQKLSESQRRAVTEAAAAMQTHERDLFLKDEQQLAQELKGKGMTFVEVDKEAFAAKAKPAVEKALPGDLLPLYHQMLETA